MELQELFYTKDGASAEGQADYFATSKCLKRYYSVIALEENFGLGTSTIPEKVLLDCNGVYKNLNDLRVCVRSQMALWILLNF